MPEFVQFSNSGGKQLTVFVSEIPKVAEPAGSQVKFLQNNLVYTHCIF